MTLAWSVLVPWKMILLCISVRFNPTLRGLVTSRRWMAGHTSQHCVLFCFFFVFSWREICISCITHSTRPPKKLSNMFHNKRDVPGSNEGQLNRGVWTLTQQRVAVSIVTLSVCRLLKLTREHSAQPDHLCTSFGSCLITALERGLQTRLERTWSYKAELMKTFGN